MHLRYIISIAIVASTSLLACTDKGKISEAKAREHVEQLASVADEDLKQLREGLPRGASSLVAEWASFELTSLPDPQTLLAQMNRVRDSERDLAIAKSTFFAVVDAEGVVVRSDQDPDILVGKDLTKSFPILRKALAGEAVESFGAMQELQGSRGGPDVQWVVAAPLRDESKKVLGAYVSGWSLQRYAYRLEHALKATVTQEANEQKGKIPLTYAFVFHDDKVYGAPITPIVNAEALEQLELPKVTASGVFHGQIEISGRSFGVAAQSVPAWGIGTGVALLRSEI